ncbi:MAG TPA: tetratricopeptide repeat protein, partial [Polyangiaceae bacterium]|nr:tetratricopeptide repeat protein [Polyangiaceae bacterium]
DPENHDALLLWERITGSGAGAESDSFDPNEPLPSYDLEEVGAEQAMHTEPGVPGKRSLHAMDDPFGSPGGDEPLPSFPLGSPTDDDLGVTGEQPNASLAEYDEDEEEISSVEDFIPPPAAAASVAVHSAPEQNYEGLEDVLDEAEFFATRGLYEDAKTILLEQLGRTPNHKLVLERLSEIEAQLGSSGDSQTKERSRLSDRAKETFDVAESLNALDALEPVPDSYSAEARQALSSTQDIDVDQVFEKFKAGVKAQVADNDSATHYDLGVAYKEMGLLPDAVGEFEVAGRDPLRECMCFAMIGLIYLEQNQLDRAAEAYVRALSAAQKTVEQEMSLYYDLGNVYEMKRQSQDALYYFQKIARRDPGYRDVSDRIRQLLPKPAQPERNARAVNDDEFDRVFDDLFESK